MNKPFKRLFSVLGLKDKYLSLTITTALLTLSLFTSAQVPPVYDSTQRPQVNNSTGYLYKQVGAQPGGVVKLGHTPPAKLAVRDSGGMVYKNGIPHWWTGSAFQPVTLNVSSPDGSISAIQSGYNLYLSSLNSNSSGPRSYMSSPADLQLDTDTVSVNPNVLFVLNGVKDTITTGASWKIRTLGGDSTQKILVYINQSGALDTLQGAISPGIAVPPSSSDVTIIVGYIDVSGSVAVSVPQVYQNKGVFFTKNGAAYTDSTKLSFDETTQNFQTGTNGFLLANNTGTPYIQVVGTAGLWMRDHTGRTLIKSNPNTGNVGIGHYFPHASALLDVSSTTKGFLPPRHTGTQMNAVSSPETGLIVYNTDSASLCFYNGSAWVKIGGGGAAPTDPVTLDAAATEGNEILNKSVIIRSEPAAYSDDEIELKPDGDFGGELITKGSVPLWATRYTPVGILNTNLSNQFLYPGSVTDSVWTFPFLFRLNGQNRTANDSGVVDLGTISGGSGSGINYVVQSSAPTDTTTLWLDNSGGANRVWQLKQKVVGGWHTVKHYDPILTVWSNEPPIYMLVPGQSNAIPRCCGGDTTSHPLVAEYRSNVWSKAQTTHTVSNNIGLQTAKELARRTGRIVRFATIAESSQPLSKWLPDSTKTDEIAALVRNAAIDSFNVIVFRQGEQNTVLGYTEAQYAAEMSQVLTAYRDSSWFGKSGIVLLGGINEAFINTGVFNFYKNVNSGKYNLRNTRGVSVLGLSQAGGIHQDGATIDTVGRRYADAFFGYTSQYALEKTPNSSMPNDATHLLTRAPGISPSFRTALNATQGIRGGFQKMDSTTSNLIIGVNNTVNGAEANDINSIHVALASGKVGLGGANPTLTTDESWLHFVPNTYPMSLSVGRTNQLQIDTSGRFRKPVVLHNTYTSGRDLWISSSSSSDGGMIRFGKSSTYLGFYQKYDGSTNLFHIGGHNTNDTTFANDGSPIMTFPRAGGGVSIKTGVAPTGYLTLGAGTATAGTAPLVFTSGTNLTTPLNGAVEYNGTNWFMTSGGTRYTVAMFTTGTAAPATTPPANGALFLDTTNKKLYVATGTSSSADWTILN